MDKHICGTCGSQYSTIEDFIQHKQSECKLVSKTPQVVQTIAMKLSTPARSKVNSTRGRQHHNVVSTATVETSSETLKGSSGKEPEKQKKKRVRKKNAEPAALETQRKAAGEKRKPNKYLKQFKCDFESCTFATAHRNDFRRHQRIHTGEKPFKCQFCEKQFSRCDKMKLHERVHTKEKPFACELCSYKCADGGSLKKHMRIHSDDRPYQCQLCSYASRNSSQLVVHLRTHTGDSPFHCQQCDAKFKTNTDLKRHILIHTGSKPFACDQCSYKSRLKCNLKSHIETNHRGKAKYQCCQCPFKCRTQKQLSDHSFKEHRNSVVSASSTSSSTKTCRENYKKVFSCEYCTYSSKYKSAWLKHTKKKHSEQLKLLDSTQVKTPTSVTMKKILVKNENRSKGTKGSKPVIPVLDGNRPWSCNICGASFIREDSFRSHRRQHEKLQENQNSATHESIENTSKTSDLESEKRCTADINHGTFVVTVGTCTNQPVSADVERSDPVRMEDMSSRNNMSQSNNQGIKRYPSRNGAGTCTSSDSSMVTLTIPDPMSMGAEVCISGDTSLIDSAIPHGNPPNNTINILPESSESQEKSCQGELMAMMPVSVDRTPSELGSNVLQTEVIIAQECDTYVHDIVEGGQLQKKDAIQFQPLGYGTSNTPILLSTVPPTIVQSPSSSCPSVINAMKTSQTKINAFENVNVSFTSPSTAAYVNLSNIGLGQVKTVPFISTNQLQSVHPPVSRGAVQQVQIKDSQHQVLDQNYIGTLNTTTNNSALTTSSTATYLNMSLSSSVTGSQPTDQTPLPKTFLPTRTFILNGRELSQAGPAIKGNDF
ncbi:zinc finger protein 64-like [Lytechinus variegatus]|uniref:zinc finger protein 64-like n=1 Tax=Lytechinus variegatus TaxID=7654 RepID=UPI001BB174A9|nr:zinc finger protein 64-like [Lytechinus variegatus]